MLESLKNFFCQNASCSDFRKLIEEKKELLEEKYNEQDKVNTDFLLTMISKGYIDEDYPNFVSISYGGLFTKNEYLFINNVKSVKKPNFLLNIEHVDLVVDEIRDHQWFSPSILNVNILTYLILNGMLEQLNGFICAIRNYYDIYKENNFIDIYFNSLNENELLQKIEHVLFHKIEEILFDDVSKKMDLNGLPAFFSEDSKKAFYKMFCYCVGDKLNEFGEIAKQFLQERKIILNYLLNEAIQNDDLRKKINVIELEVEKISEYNGSVLNFLVNDGLFVLSKENLDYILASQNNLRAREYYDFLRKNEKLRIKVINSDRINDFVSDFLLDSDEVKISQEGITELLLFTQISEENAKNLINKLDNEYVDLTKIPKNNRKSIAVISDFSPNVVHYLIQGQKIKIDFNNVLYAYYWSDIEDIVLLVKQVLNREKNKLVKIDEYAKSAYLEPFYCLLMDNSHVDLVLFKDFSLFLINQKIDIIGLASLEIIKSNNVSTEKMRALLELSFGRKRIFDSSIGALLKLAKNNFDYLIKRFKFIKKWFVNDWFVNMAYLLKNENGDKSLKDFVLSESQISGLIREISPDDFAKIMKIWIGLYGIEDSSKIVEKILNKERLSIWNDSFGMDAIKNFLGNYNYSFDNRVASKIKNNLDEVCSKRDAGFTDDLETEFSILGIANQFGFGKRAVVDYFTKTNSGQKMIALLKEDFLNQNKIDEEMKRFSNESQGTKPLTVYNDLFIIGRFFYKAIDRGAYNVSTFLLFGRGYFLRHYMDYLLLGAVFESYFDHGRLKRNQKKMHFDDLIKAFEQSRYDRGIRFIRECLMLYKDEFIFIPGDEEVAFEIVCNKKANEEIVDSIECNHVDILTDYSKSDQRLSYEIVKVFDKVSIYELKYMIRNYFTIPEYRIGLYYGGSHIPEYITFTNKKLFRPLKEIVHEVKISKGKRWGERLF